MVFEELVSSFIYSRKQGLRESGAKKKATPVTIANYEAQLRVMVDFMEDKRGKFKWDAVEREDVRAFVEHINNRTELSESTRLTYLRTFRTLLHFIDKDEECQESELKGIKQFKRLLPAIGQNARREFIPTPNDLKMWQKAFNTDDLYGFRNYVAFSLWIDTGIRLSELSTLRLDRIQLDANQIFVEGKTGPRTVPITEKSVRLLKAWLKRRIDISISKDSPYVFVGHAGERCGRSGFGQVFRKMRKLNPSLPRLTAHLLRHSFGTYYLRGDGNLERLRIIMGHADIRTTQKYLHLAQVGGEQMKVELEAVSPLKMLDEVRVK
jgi:site-specific recombinase XerD